MEVCRQLLPIFEVCKDGQRDGCAMDGVASPADEARPSTADERAWKPGTHHAFASILLR